MRLDFKERRRDMKEKHHERGNACELSKKDGTYTVGSDCSDMERLTHSRYCDHAMRVVTVLGLRLRDKGVVWTTGGQ